MAAITGLYTVYGGLPAVAWTSSFQCLLLLGGGLYVFFAGMAKIGWDFRAVLGNVEGQQADSVSNSGPSTNVWYYATNHNRSRCLATEGRAKMGVLSQALQVLLPLATWS